MKTSSKASRARSAIFAAGALLALMTLGGCGGGGGGGFVNVPPVPFMYPASLKDATSSDTVDGFISPYALNTSTYQLRSTTPTVSGTSPSAGKITISVNAITLPDSNVEPAFSVTFDPSASTTPLTNSPLEILLPACADCLKTATATSSDSKSSPVTFTYLDPSAFGLNYSALGIWEKPTTTGTGGTVDSTWPVVGGAFSAGVLTRGIDLPTTGSANYSGYFIGRYVTSVNSGLATPGTYLVGANASATANFGASRNGLVFNLEYKHCPRFRRGHAGSPRIAMPGLDLNSGAMPITRTSTSNGFRRNSRYVSNGLSGPIQGGFYGPPATSGDFAPPELGGSLSVTNNLNQSMVGKFRAQEVAVIGSHRRCPASPAVSAADLMLAQCCALFSSSLSPLS